MLEIEYTKKPSITTLRAAIRKAAGAGVCFISLQWGENRILIERTQWGWLGTGWIGRNSGHDLAKEIKGA
jgi:hypothetical protein